MFINNEMPLSRAKMGWYEVNGIRYLNKYHALENCLNDQWPDWNFNNKAYSLVPWEQEPTEDLYEIYKQRAVQLREKYDFLLLYYSGGIDSHAVLRSFVDNDIKLDGVIISGSYSVGQESEWTCNQEQLLVALPYLEKLKKEGKLKFPVFCLDTVKYHKFEDENWVYACGQSLTPQVYSYNNFWQEPWIQEFLMQGSTAFIRGVDKPRIILEDNTWYVSFLDVHIMSGTPTGRLAKNQDWDIQEYFYWTPDMPEIVQKQAHLMINWFEKNLNKEQISQLTSKEAKTFNRATYNNYADPLVYGKYVDQIPGHERPYFTLGKPLSANVWHKDLWFFQSRDLMKSEYNKWIAGLQMLDKKISKNHFNSKHNNEDAIAKFAKEYNLDKQALDLGPILFGTVGTWSKFYKVKNYEDRRSLTE
jgi:hypothetical protein